MEDDKQVIRELRARLADHMLAVEMLSRMARAAGESAVADEVLQLFMQLFAPRGVAYMPVVDGEPGATVTRGQPAGSPGAHDLRAIPHDPSGLRRREDGFVLYLTRDEDLLGVVDVEGVRIPEHIERYLDIAAEIGGLLALAISNARAYDKLAWISATDELTQLPNRRHCFERLEAELSRFQRRQGVLAVAMLDVDSFKRINDEHGHNAGDAVLRGAAQRMADWIRPYDLLARFGGDEFLLMAPEIAVDDAGPLAERLRTCITESPFAFGGEMFRVTVSVGVTVATTDDPSIESVVARADKALYESKQAGRDRVTVITAMADAGRV